MAKVMIVDNVAPEAAQILEQEGHEVRTEAGKLDTPDLIAACAGCQGLIVRSATKVTAEFMAARPELSVVGRAGVGVDNIDIDAASEHGILVVNAPTGNTIAAAEHTLALMFALARHIPQAMDTLCQGRWERKRFLGVELAGKTLGVLGLGRVGSAVAQRAEALGMRVLAYDPYISPEQVAVPNIKLTSFNDVVRQADFITLHLPLTDETRGIISKQALAQMKPGVRLINAARGALVDEAALADALKSGQVAGAALDVFAEEPCTNSPLLGLDNVVMTPHLGASTKEAQVHVAVEVAKQVADALAGRRPKHCLNWERALQQGAAVGM
ncbi:MAG: phosphoglycerate dehydrogenase [Firmicutes bacterium]|nr:phosphoglycerate dehydrogenase [Bacillota bacterium]